MENTVDLQILIMAVVSKTDISKNTKYFKFVKKMNLNVPWRRNPVLTDLLAFAIDYWILPKYIPEHFGIFPKFNDGRR